MEVLMVIRRLACIMVWAAGAFGLALAFGIPATSNAVDETNSPGVVATILTPKLTVNGVELTVTQDAPATRPSKSDGPLVNRPMEFVVHSENKTSASASGEFVVRLTSVAPARPQARTLSVPTEVWKDSARFVLKAGETRDYAFTTPPLSPDRLFTVSLDSSADHVAILSMVERNP
jgi:hypothetical protein